MGFLFRRTIDFLGVIVHLIFLVFIIGGLWKGTQFCQKRYTRYITYRQLQGASLWQVH